MSIKIKSKLSVFFSNPRNALRNKVVIFFSHFKMCYVSVFKISKIYYRTYGAKIYLDLTKDVDNRLFLYGFENDTMKYYCKILKKNNVILDIGANIGIYSLIASNKIGANGKVFSFEPADIAFKSFVRNIELNKFNNIFPIKSGVSNYTGNAVFNICDDDAYNSLGDTPMKNVIRKESIDIISIDDFVFKNGIDRVNVIKVDTEGAEFLVFKGAEKTLTTYRPILFFEYNPRVTKGFLNNPEDLINYIKSFNYFLYEIYHGKTVKIENFEEIKGYDIIGLPQ